MCLSVFLYLYIHDPLLYRMLLLGLTNNHLVSGVHLDLSSNELRNPGAQVLEAVIGYLHNISSLDISNNGQHRQEDSLDMYSVCFTVIRIILIVSNPFRVK